MADTPEKTPRKRAALQVLEFANNVYVKTTFGIFDSRAEALEVIAKNGKAGVKYLIAEAEPKCIEEQTRVSRKLV